MKFLVVLCGVVACAMSQVVYYTSPYVSPYGHIATSYSHIATPYAAAPVVTASAPVVAAAAPIIHPVSSQYRAQDELGQFTFATAGDNQARVETGLVDGSVRGAYSYLDPTGKLVNVQYLADNQGFRVLGANNLPEAPEAPAVPALKGPEPVQDTPEVVAARADFQKKFAEAAAAAAASPDQTPVSRRKRQVLFASPYVASPYVASSYVASPVVAKTTVKVHQYEPVDAKVPASTRKFELKESEREVVAPLPLAYAAAPHVVSTSHVVAAPQVVAAAPTVYSVAPQVVAAPAVAKTTVKVQEYEPVDAKVPASTRKIELKESEKEVVAPISVPLSVYSPIHYTSLLG